VWYTLNGANILDLLLLDEVLLLAASLESFWRLATGAFGAVVIVVKADGIFLSRKVLYALARSSPVVIWMRINFSEDLGSSMIR